MARLLTGGVEEASAYLRVSPRTLRRMFARSGLRIVDVVRETRKRAGADALAARRPLKRVAAELGFSSLPNLYRFIRREFGTGVRECRRAFLPRPWPRER